MKAVSQQTVKGVSPMVWVFEVQLEKRSNCLESDFRLKGANVSDDMKKAFEYCNVGAHCKVGNRVAMLPNRSAVVHKIEVIAASALKKLHDVGNGD